jgi:DNA-binding SARP family transcriptional activator
MLRTLGALELSGPGGNAVADLLSRPKPLGVLLYLALGEEAAAHRRDTLLALFWPDADAERARGSLRQTVYLLRRALGAPAIVGRGEEIGLAAHALHCDAADFRRRLALGDLAGALALYRGELLPGFFVEGAPGFDHWLEDQRRQLHHAATSAARSLAAAAERTGDEEEALAWSRRAVALASDDEPAVRRLIVLLERMGDRAAARRAYDAFATHLRDRHGLAPSAETSALVAASAGVPGRPAPARAPLEARRVLVAPFENETGVATLDPLGRLAADVVAQAIAQLDDVQVVPLTAALLSVRHVDAAAGDARGPARARLAAEETGAATVVGGAYYAAGDELVMQGWIGDVRDQRMLGALLPARAPLAAPFPAIESLRDQARTALALQLETRATHVRAAGRAPSYEAHGAYVEGITRFVDGDWRGALRHLERSAARDATYALPLLVSAIAHWNLGELEAADAVAGRAGAVMAGAGPFERALLDMVRAWLAGGLGGGVRGGPPPVGARARHDRQLPAGRGGAAPQPPARGAAPAGRARPDARRAARLGVLLGRDGAGAAHAGRPRAGARRRAPRARPAPRRSAGAAAGGPGARRARRRARRAGLRRGEPRHPDATGAPRRHAAARGRAGAARARWRG